MKNLIVIFCFFIISFACKKEDKINSKVDDITGVYGVCTNKTYRFTYNDSVYVKYFGECTGLGSYMVIEKTDTGYRAFSVTGIWDNPQTFTENVNVKNIRYFYFNRNRNINIFMYNLPFISGQPGGPSYRDSIVFTYHNPYPTVFTDIDEALIGTFQNMHYERVGMNPPGSPEPYIYAWVRVTYDVRMEKICKLEDWPKLKCPYVFVE